MTRHQALQSCSSPTLYRIAQCTQLSRSDTITGSSEHPWLVLYVSAHLNCLTLRNQLLLPSLLNTAMAFQWKICVWKIRFIFLATFPIRRIYSTRTAVPEKILETANFFNTGEFQPYFIQLTALMICEYLKNKGRQMLMTSKGNIRLCS